MTLGSGIRVRFFRLFGSQTLISESLVTIVWVRSTIMLCQLAHIVFLYLFKHQKVSNLVKFVATKKGGVRKKTILSFPSSFVVVIGSGTGWIKIRVRDKHSEFATLYSISRPHWHNFLHCSTYRPLESIMSRLPGPLQRLHQRSDHSATFLSSVNESLTFL